MSQGVLLSAMRGAWGIRLIGAGILLATLQEVVAQDAQCSNDPRGAADERRTSAPQVGAFDATPRAPRQGLMLGDFIGLDSAKAVLKEAIVAQASSARNLEQLFRYSSEQSAVLLVGPMGMGKTALTEAAAASIGADVIALHSAHAVDFCRIAMAAGVPIVVVVERLEDSPAAAVQIRQCLRQVSSALLSGSLSNPVYIVATLSLDLQHISASALAPFGFVAHARPPDQGERKQYLLKAMAAVSRVDAQWGSALRDAAMEELATMTANYTFAELDFLLRRAFVRSTTSEGTRDPVALHHFEQILADMSAWSTTAFNDTAVAEETLPASSPSSAGDSKGKAGKTSQKTKDKQQSKDPMEGIFGWCNFWLPEALHLPPVVWAMIIFGVFAHFMARSTYQPYGHRKRRGGNSPRRQLFGEMGTGSHPYSNLGDTLGDWSMGGNPFAGFPPPPGMPPMPGMPGAPTGGAERGERSGGERERGGGSERERGGERERGSTPAVASNAPVGEGTS